MSASFTQLSIKYALRRALGRVVLYLYPFALFHHNFDVITIFFYYLNELLAFFALGLPLPLPAYMTNAVDDACALRDCRSSAGLAQTVSRSLLAGLALACLELAGESVDFVQLLLPLFPLTRSFSLLFTVLSQVRCSPKSEDLTQVEFCVAFGDQRLIFLLAFVEEILTRSRPSSNCAKMSIVTK